MQARHLLYLVAGLIAPALQATTYYCSTSGSSGNSGTDQTHTWDLTAVNTNLANGKVHGGDSVLFASGQSFYGTLTVAKSGSSGSPITFGADGLASGKPKLTGFKTALATVVVSSSSSTPGWVALANGVYEYNQPFTNTSLNMVAFRSAQGVLTQQRIGRYPNWDDAATGGYLNLDSATNSGVPDSSNPGTYHGTGTTTLTDSALQSSTTNWTGGELVLRYKHWRLDRGHIDSHSGTTLTFSGITYEDKNPPDVPDTGCGYFIQNHIKACDQLGEYCYSSAKKLQMYFGSGGPSAYTVLVSTVDTLVDVGVNNYLVFDNLSFEGPNQSGIAMSTPTPNPASLSVTVSNCDFNLSGVNAMVCTNRRWLNIHDNTVANSNDTGLRLQFETRSSTIKNNTVTNTHLFAGMGQGGDGHGSAIYATGQSDDTAAGQGNLIEGNTILDSGFLPIHFGGNETIVQKNVIQRFCSVKDDGGGIYTAGARDKNWTGRQVLDNIILDGIGAPAGSADGHSEASGIYMDQCTSGVTIARNTVSRMSNNGLMYNSTRNMVAHDNTLYDCAQCLDLNGYANVAMSNDTIYNNTFFAKTSDQWAFYYDTAIDDVGTAVDFHDNVYARPLESNITHYLQHLLSGSTVTKHLGLADWKAYRGYGQDAGSTLGVADVPAYTVNSRSSTNLFTDGTCDTTPMAVNTGGGSCSVYSPATPVFGTGPCYKIICSGSGATRNFSMTAGKTYLLKFDVKSSVSGSLDTIGVSVRRQPTGYDTLCPNQERKLPSTATTYELAFTAPETTTAQLLFKASSSTPYYLDNVSLNDADVAFTDPDDEFQLVYNATAAAVSKSIYGKWINAYSGTSYLNTVPSSDLPAYGSVMLVKDHSGTIYEGDGPAQVGSSGGTISVCPASGTDSNLMGGVALQYDATSDSDYLLYKIPSMAVGSYRVFVGSKKYSDRGNLRMNGATSAGSAGTPFGVTITQVTSSYTYSETEVTTDSALWPVTVAGDRWIRVYVPANAGNRKIVLDYLRVVKQ